MLPSGILCIKSERVKVIRQDMLFGDFLGDLIIVINLKSDGKI